MTASGRGGDIVEGTSRDPNLDTERLRRLAWVFGEVLPESTSDDLDAGERAPSRDSGEDWLRRQVPPHHG